MFVVSKILNRYDVSVDVSVLSFKSGKNKKIIKIGKKFR